MELYEETVMARNIYKKPLRNARVRRELLRGKTKGVIRRSIGNTPVQRRADQLNLKDADADVKKLESGRMTGRRLKSIKQTNKRALRLK